LKEGEFRVFPGDYEVVGIAEVSLYSYVFGVELIWLGIEWEDIVY